MNTILKSLPVYITTEDGLINYSKLTLQAENIYKQYHTGTERQVISVIETNIKDIMKQCNDMLTDLREKKNSIDQGKIF